jgi:hypothetical protein
MLATAVVLPIVLSCIAQLAGTYWNALGWLFVTVIGFGLLARFTTIDLKAQQSQHHHGQTTLVAAGRIAALASTFMSSAWSAYQFADWFARLPMFLGA